MNSGMKLSRNFHLFTVSMIGTSLAIQVIIAITQTDPNVVPYSPIFSFVAIPFWMTGCICLSSEYVAWKGPASLKVVMTFLLIPTLAIRLLFEYGNFLRTALFPRVIIPSILAVDCLGVFLIGVTLPMCSRQFRKLSQHSDVDL